MIWLEVVATDEIRNKYNVQYWEMVTGIALGENIYCSVICDVLPIGYS